jgi:hypothetical protein
VGGIFVIVTTTRAGSTVAVAGTLATAASVVAVPSASFTCCVLQATTADIKTPNNMDKIVCRNITKPQNGQHDQITGCT